MRSLCRPYSPAAGRPPPDRTTRDPGQPGVRLRLYADLEQEVADGGTET
ncbi:DUF6207 family protein [Streptomyces bottropensis]